MELPNKAPTEEIMDFKKYAETSKNMLYNEDTVIILGEFKRKGSDEVISGDNFRAKRVIESGKGTNAETIYKTYLGWFNYTLRPFESERIFVSAKFGTEEDLK